MNQVSTAASSSHPKRVGKENVRSSNNINDNKVISANILIYAKR